MSELEAITFERDHYKDLAARLLGRIHAMQAKYNIPLEDIAELQKAMWEKGVAK